MNYETLCLLADFYHVTTDYLLGRQEAIPSFLSEDERTCIEQLRALDERGHNAVRNALGYEYALAAKSKANNKTPPLPAK